MLRRLVVAVGLVAAAGLGYYVWKTHAGALPATGEIRMPPKVTAEGIREEAGEKLTELGHALRSLKLATSVKTALSLNRHLRSSAIDVAAESGVVTLSGRVDADEQRAQAEAITGSVPGVDRVVNQIQVVAAAKGAAGRTLGETLDDETVATRVRLALSLDRELSGSDVTVEAYRREVTLGGEVGSPGQRERAVQTARDTDSVAGVVDRIRVRIAAARPGASNAEKAAAAQRAVDANPHLTAFGLQVREVGGRLVLRGAVKQAVEKDLAIVLAREAAGEGVEDAVEVHAGA